MRECVNVRKLWVKMGSYLLNKIRSYGVIFEELWSYLKGVMELEGVKELSQLSVLTFFSRVVMELFLRS